MSYYVLEQTPPKDTEGCGTTFTDTDDAITGDAPCCPVCGSILGPLVWLPPYKVELDVWGRGYGDWVVGTGNSVLVSERFRLLWEEQGLTGLSGFDPVEIVKIAGRRRVKSDPPRYFHTEVLRSDARVDDVASDVVRRRPATCKVCLSGDIVRIRRVVLDTQGKATPDVFFAVGLPGVILASERFREFCERHKITNVICVPAEQYGYDYSEYEGGQEAG